MARTGRSEPNGSVDPEGDLERARIAADARRQSRLARGVGPTRRGDLTPAQMALRDTAIIASIHSGMTAREVAGEFLLSQRQIEKIVAKHRRMRSPLEQAPIELLERLLRSYEAQLAKFDKMALDTMERAPAVAIAAAKASAETLERYVTLLVDLGKLPENLEMFRNEAEMIRVGQMMREQVVRAERGEVSLGELREFFDGVMTRQEPVWELASGDFEEVSDGGVDRSGGAGAGGE